MEICSWLSSANKSSQEVFWMKNPDYRLGQLIAFASRPSTPHPTNPQDTKIPDWEENPDICRIKPEDVSIELIQELLSIIKRKRTI
jgi:hypothetical protein